MQQDAGVALVNISLYEPARALLLKHNIVAALSELLQGNDVQQEVRLPLLQNPTPTPTLPYPYSSPYPSPLLLPLTPTPTPDQVGLALLQNVSLYAQSHAELLQGGFLARIARFISSSWSASRVKVPPWQCPSSAPAPSQCAPGGSGQRGTLRVRPGL